MTTNKAIGEYRLYHRIDKEFNDVQASSAQEACDKVHWLIGDVWVRQYTPIVNDPSTESGHRGGGWRNITPRSNDNIQKETK